MSSDTAPPDPKELYDATYYAHHCGGAYERNDAWTTFFGSIAERIVEDIQPTSVLDVGCALGFLVEALRDRGVEAYGIDISEFAVGQARRDMAEFVTVGSALDTFRRRYDLITCIEVLEHLDPADAQRAVANIATHTDEVLLTSTPHDFSEETHINVQQPEYWTELFARHGLYRDVDYDVSYLVPWAMRFRRSHTPVPRLLGEYERALWRARHELDERNKVVLSQMRQADEWRGQQADLGRLRTEHARLVDEVRTLELSLTDRDERAAALADQAASALSRSTNLEAALRSRPVRAMLTFQWRAGMTLRRAAPPNTRRREGMRLARRASAVVAAEGATGVLRRIKRRLNGSSVRGETTSAGDEQYAKWLEQHRPTEATLTNMRIESSEWSYRPLVSIVVPVYNTPALWLDHMISSVLAQVYPNWELCLADDCSPDPRVRTVLSRWASLDGRIRVAYRDQNGNIAAASNTALDLARGEYVALLDHDDVLTPHALHRMVAALQVPEPADVLYSDEDKVLLTGQRGQVHFKGSFDPDYLLSTNYICHLSMFRRSLLVDLGGFRSGVDGSQDHDIALRATSVARRVEHIPDVLYSWKQVPGSAALDMSAKPAAWEAGRKAAEDLLRTRVPDARVELGPHAGLLVARYPIPRGITSAVVVCAEGATGLADAMRGLRRGLAESDTRLIVATHDPRLREHITNADVIVGDLPFNSSKLLNAVTAEVDVDVLVFIGEGLVPERESDWLSPLLEQAARPEVGAVGGRIMAHDGHVLQEGLRIGGPRVAAHVGVRWPVIQRVDAVSALCMAVDRKSLHAVNGFDERFRISLFDVDLCMRLRRNGRSVIYTPLTQLRRVRPVVELGYGQDDCAVFTALWKDAPDTDPYVSPWLERVQPPIIRLSG